MLYKYAKQNVYIFSSGVNVYNIDLKTKTLQKGQFVSIVALVVLPFHLPATRDFT